MRGPAAALSGRTGAADGVATGSPFSSGGWEELGIDTQGPRPQVARLLLTAWLPWEQLSAVWEAGAGGLDPGIQARVGWHSACVAGILPGGCKVPLLP